MNSIDEDNKYIRDSLDELIDTLKERLNEKYSVKLMKSIQYLETTNRLVTRNISIIDVQQSFS